VKPIVVSGSFDDLRSRQVRILQEAARLGPVEVQLWSDAVVEALTGKPPKFPYDERRYLLDAIRFVGAVTHCDTVKDADSLPQETQRWGAWVVDEACDTPAKRDFCRAHALEYRVLTRQDLDGFPDEPRTAVASAANKRVLVTGCYDWFHSGHVRFFEEVAALGDLYVVVGHDANIELLKGKGHPLFPEQERRYMVSAIRFVAQALVATGNGWLDAEPEIERIRPHIYAVNEDGDRPEKRAYCEAHAIEYRVLKRLPREGLPRRQSTTLRGF